MVSMCIKAGNDTFTQSKRLTDFKRKVLKVNIQMLFNDIYITAFLISRRALIHPNKDEMQNK